MKNLLKKLGVFTLLISVLLPFVELPVKAASEECTSYLQNYLFMSSGWATSAFPILAEKASGENGGYKTFTSFPYDFPTISDGETLTIEAVEGNDLTNKVELEKFFVNFVKLARDDLNISKDEITKYGNIIYTNSNMNDVDTITYLLHGKWGEVGGDGEWEPGVYLEKEGHQSYLFNIVENNERFKDFYNTSFSGYINSAKPDEIALKTQVSGGGIINNKYSEANSEYVGSNENLVKYFQKIVDDVNDGLIDTESDDKGYVWVDNDKKYISLSINRTLDTNKLSDYVFSRVLDGTEYILSTSSDKITDSYKAYEYRYEQEHGDKQVHKCGESVTTDCYNLINKTNFSDITTINTSGVKYSYTNAGQTVSGEYAYYFPYVLGVKYKVCSNATDKWTLKYDANTDDVNVTRIPSAQTVNINEEIKVSEGPNRSGYKFVKWCTNADGTGDCYESGKSLKFSEPKTITLYAQWAETGTTDNKDTGVGTYILSFISVGVIASGIYVFARKKNLFGQI